METAEKLAKFVAQVGPEIEQFSIENSTDNPDLWYVPIPPFWFELFAPQVSWEPTGWPSKHIPALAGGHTRISHNFTSAELRAVREKCLFWGMAAG